MLNLTEGQVKYINMCMAMDEYHKLVQGDYVFDGRNIHVIAEDFIGVSQFRSENVIDVSIREGSEGVGHVPKVRYTNAMLSDFIWLPTIDQLLDEIIKSTQLETQWDVHEVFLDELRKHDKYYYKSHGLAEAYLKLYMDLVHGKVWTGESWRIEG